MIQRSMRHWESLLPEYNEWEVIRFDGADRVIMVLELA